jgi:hypothetical protein
MKASSTAPLSAGFSHYGRYHLEYGNPFNGMTYNGAARKWLEDLRKSEERFRRRQLENIQAERLGLQFLTRIKSGALPCRGRAKTEIKISEGAAPRCNSSVR